MTATATATSGSRDRAVAEVGAEAPDLPAQSVGGARIERATFGL